jgi:hypothetical protein
MKTALGGIPAEGCSVLELASFDLGHSFGVRLKTSDFLFELIERAPQ